MRLFYIGTGIVICAAILPYPLVLMGVPHTAVAAIVTIVGVGGFLLQMYGAFKMRAAHENTLKQMRNRHEAKMAAAQRLPAAQAIRLLLQPDDD